MADAFSSWLVGKVADLAEKSFGSRQCLTGGKSAGCSDLKETSPERESGENYR